MSKSDDPNSWRELCAKAAVEEDSAKLAGLVEQIIKTLDNDQVGSHSASSASASVLPQQ